MRVVTVLAALGGRVRGAHPTGISAFDPLVTAGLAASVTALSSRARRGAWAGAAGITLIASSTDVVLFVLAFAVFVAAVTTSVVDVRNRVLGALLGAATVQILVRLPPWGPFGFPSLLAAIAIGLLVVSGFRKTTRPTRRRVAVGALVLLGLAVVATALFAGAVLRARSDLDAGIAATNHGISAARQGDTTTAASNFEQARHFLVSASHTLDTPWAQAAAAVPVVGQHQRALRTLTSDATRLAATGAQAARDADVDKLRVENGRLDLALVAAMRAPLTRVEAALAAARHDLAAVNSRWLLGPVRHRLDQLTGRVDRAAGSARTAALGIDAAPRLFGRDRPFRFFLMFTTPSEARSSGFMGNWAILTIDDGKLNFTQFGRTEDLNAAGDPTSRKITGPADFLARYGRYQPEQDWRSVTMSPDFPTVARVVRELAPQSGLAPIDGVIAIDPEGLAALLKVTGPVTVPGRAEPLTATNAADFLLRGQYEIANPQRIDFLDEAAHAETSRLTHGSLPGPRNPRQSAGARRPGTATSFSRRSTAQVRSSSSASV